MSAWSFRILWVCLMSVFLLNDSFIFPAKQHSHALRPAVLIIGLGASFIPFHAFQLLDVLVGSMHPLSAPYQAFKTSDSYVVIGAGSQGLFQRLCRVIGCESLVHDPRFESQPARTGKRIRTGRTH